MPVCPRSRHISLWTRRCLSYPTPVSPTDAKRGHIELFLASTGWAPSTQRTALAYLRAAYEYAVDALELVPRNPCRRVTLPKATKHVPRVIAHRVLRELKAAVRDDDDDLLLHLFMYTGMRTIEVRRLTWTDVSMADNTLHVHGKGDKWRLIPIHPELRKRLVVFKHATLYVVPGRRGGMVTAGGLHYRMQRIVGEREIQNHDFRRTFATSLRANRVDPYVRDALLGWSEDSMFASHYNAVSMQELQAAILKVYADDPV
jgi:integrase/recombinase XerC